MKSDLRISVKGYSRNKISKFGFARLIFQQPAFWVKMNGQPWPNDGRPVSLARLLTAFRKSLVKSIPD